MYPATPQSTTRVSLALFLLVFCLIASGRSRGQNLLAEDSFNASVIPLDSVSTGFGWARAWEVQNNSVDVPGYNLATSSPLTYPGISTADSYAVGGDNWQSAGRLLDTSSDGVFSPYLLNGLIGQPGTSLVFGVLIRKDVNSEDQVSVTLHPGNPPWWVNAPGIAVGYFGGASDSSGIRYWSLSVAGSDYPTDVPLVVGQTAWLVVQIDFGATNTVAMYVNPPANALPSSPDTEVNTADSIAFQSVAFYGGSASNESSIGELRFAASYGALVAGLPPSPTAPASVTSQSGNGTVALSWSPVSVASQYQVFRTVNGSTELQATTTGTSFLDTGLINRTAYTYYIVAANSSGASGPSPQVTAVPHGPPPPPIPALGTNLTALADYGREWPFVDAFKTARQWISQEQGGSWGEGPPLQLDAHGWITALQPGQYAETIMLDNAVDDMADYPTGQYILLYDGSGVLSFDMQTATIVSQSPGRMVVNVPSGLNGIYLIESATDPTNPIRNIRFIMPDFESTYQTQPFHPLFLERLQNYQVLRFMEWMLTNGSTVTNWSDRALPSDYTYTWRGVPLEVLIKLANTLNVKPWFNIPAQASDTYVAQFAALLKKKLNPALAFYLEYSNETWNSSFSQSAYVQAQGLAAGFSTNPTLSGADYTAYRSVQVFNTFASVLGSPNQMIRVIASQAANSWLSAQTLSFQNAFASADVLAIAPYFNCDDSTSGGFGILGDPSTAAEVDAMSVSQIETVQLGHINNCALQEMQQSAGVASSFGLKLVAYEGGQSLVGLNEARGDSTMTAQFAAANRDTAMGQLYAQYLQNWVSSGGDLFVHYSDIAADSRYGNFGALEYQDQDPGTSPKYMVLQSFALQCAEQ